jgi:Arc/MetJ family transcription regulator
MWIQAAYRTQRVMTLRTNFEFDDQLLAGAQSLCGSSTTKQSVERALRLMVDLDRQLEVKRLRGRLNWNGDLEEMRRDGS